MKYINPGLLQKKDLTEGLKCKIQDCSIVSICGNGLDLYYDAKSVFENKEFFTISV